MAHELSEYDRMILSIKAPFVRRQQLVYKIRDNWESGEALLRTWLGQLEEEFGCADPGNDIQDPEKFPLDGRSRLFLQRLRYLNHNKISGWRDEGLHILTEFLGHISPPVVYAKSLPPVDASNLTQLYLTGIHLRSRTLLLVKGIVKKNQRLWSVELSYTGLDNKGLFVLLEELRILSALTYLGLRGNRLNKFAVAVLDEYSRTSFPNLMWIDLKNNADIFHLPMSFMANMRKHFPTEGYLPSFQDIDQGHAVVAAAFSMVA